MRVTVLTDCELTWDYAPVSRLLKIAEEISADCHEVRVVGRTVGVPMKVKGIRVIGLHIEQGHNKLRRASFVVRREVLRNIAWGSAVMIRGYWIGMCGMLVASLLLKRIRIYDFHGFMHKEQAEQGRKLRSVTTKLIEYICLHLSTHVLTVSRGVYAQLPSKWQKKTLMVENGVDWEQFSENGPVAQVKTNDLIARLTHDPVFCLIGTLGPWLDTVEVVEAFARLSTKAQVVIMGDGRGEALAKEAVNRLKSENVHVVGRRAHEVAKWLVSKAVGGLCPYAVNWSHAARPGFFAQRKIKEYMAAGKVVVVSDVPAREEFLADGENCVLYTAGDPSCLAAAVDRVLSDRELARRIASQARATAQDFSWRRIYEKSGLSEVLAREQAHES